MRLWFGVLLVSLAACGEQRSAVSSPLTAGCALASGTYVNEATRTSMVGTCPRAKEHTRDKIEFDEGSFVSPAAVFIPCSTEQVECSLRITCQVLDLKMVFTGELVEESSRIVGTLAFTGEGDCKSAVYDLVATRPPEP